jgi:hypothetical protein
LNDLHFVSCYGVPIIEELLNAGYLLAYVCGLFLYVLCIAVGSCDLYCQVLNTGYIYVYVSFICIIYLLRLYMWIFLMYWKRGPIHYIEYFQCICDFLEWMASVEIVFSCFELCLLVLMAYVFSLNRVLIGLPVWPIFFMLIGRHCFC